MEPGDEQVMAVTFAPTDAQFLAEATSVTALGQTPIPNMGAFLGYLVIPMVRSLNPLVITKIKH